MSNFKNVVASLFFIACLGCARTAIQEVVETEAENGSKVSNLDRALESSVLIGSMTGPAIWICGSGTVVQGADGLVVITAAHVVDDVEAEALRIISDLDGEYYEVAEAFVSDQFMGPDAAVLVTKEVIKVPGVVLGSDPSLRPGSQYASIRVMKRAGRPEISMMYTRGAGAFHADEPVVGGDSGSGVFDLDGNLVGIVISHQAMPSNPSVVRVERVSRIRNRFAELLEE